MRRIPVSLVVVTLALVVFGSSSVLKTTARNEATVLVQAPGTRCFRMTYGPKEKKKKRKTVVDTGTVMPRTRCARFSSGGREGTIFPNAAPRVGLATSTAYIATRADTQVNLKAIACDADHDTLLYTYSSTCGRIQGEGPAAVWNLTGVTRPATCIVSVEVDDGCGCVSSDSAEVTLE